MRTLSEEGRYGLNRATIEQRLTALFGGLAAETVVFGGHSSGASSDLQQCRTLARLAVRTEGMHTDLPGGVNTQFWEGSVSPDLLQRCEEAETYLLGNARARAIEWLTNSKDLLVAFATHVMNERELDGEEVVLWMTANNASDQLEPVNSETGLAARGTV